jgi:TRAP-type transport system small permease protein
MVAGTSTLAARVQTCVGRGVRVLLGLVLLAMVLLNVANAVGRRAFGTVLIGADEVLVFSMVWLVMIGMLLIAVERSHISLDFLPARAKPRTRLILAIVQHAVMAAACAYAAFQSLAYVQRIAALGQTSMSLGMPMSIPHTALIVGLAGTAVIGVVLVVSDLVELAQRCRAGSRRDIE